MAKQSSMLRVLPLILLTFLCSVATAQIGRVDAFRIGTTITTYIGQCGQEPDDARGKLTFCDRAGNLNVVTESLGLSDRGVRDLLVNHFDQREVYLTRNGVSIYRPGSGWDNVPNQALTWTDSRGDVQNSTSIVQGVVTEAGELQLISNGGGNRVHLYDLATREMRAVDVPGFLYPRVIAHDPVSDTTWMVATTQNQARLYALANDVITSVTPLVELNHGGFNAPNAQLRVHDKQLWLNTNRGLYAIDLHDFAVTEWDATTTGLLPLDNVTDFDFDPDGSVWLAATGSSRGAIIKLDPEANTIESYTTTGPNSTVQLSFTDLALLPDGTLAVQATNENALLFLDPTGEEAVWSRITQPEASELGVPYTYVPAKVDFRDGRLYYLTNDFSTGNTDNFEVLIRESGRWYGRNDNAPGNNSYRELERYSHFVPGYNGEMFMLDPADNTLVHATAAGHFTARYLTNLAYLEGAADETGDLFFYGGNQTQLWQQWDRPFLRELSGLERTAQQVAASGNVAYFLDRTKGIISRLVSGTLASRDTLPAGNYGNFFFFTVGESGDAWMASDREGSGTVFLRYNFVTNELQRIEREEKTGAIRNVQPHPDGGVVVFGQLAVLHFDGTTARVFAASSSDLVSSIGRGRVDTEGRVYFQIQRNGAIMRVDDLTDPASAELYDLESVVPYTGVYSPGDFGIDANGNIWTNGETVTYRYTHTYDDPQYRPTGDAHRITGRVYVDLNENGRFDSGEAQPNQTVAVRAGDQVFQTLTNEAGQYAYLLELENTDHEVSLPTLDRFTYTDTRRRTVAVTTLDRDYANIDFALEAKDYASLYFKSANRTGAWGMDRDGFDNTFTTTVTNLSTFKAYRELAIDFSYFNETAGGGELPTVTGVKVTELRPTGLPYVVNHIRINPINHRWSVSLTPDTYQSSTPNFTYALREVADTVTVALELPTLEARATYVIEVETERFEPARNGQSIGYGTRRVKSEDLGGGSGSVNENTVILIPEDADGGSWDPPFDDPNSPYLDPSEVYGDDPYFEPSEVYTDPPYYTPIRSSFDPNQKLVDGGVTTGENATDVRQRWLIYTVQFENEGNFSAKDVYVVDTLDALVDPSSLTVLEGSHAFTTDFLRRDSVTVLRFNFEDIYLSEVDSLNDGWVRFALRAREDADVGDAIANAADIYFDQNDPIRTNTVVNRYVEATTPIRERDLPEVAVAIYPNPTSDRLRVESAAAVTHLRLYDLTGRLVRQWAGNPEMRLSALPSGSYVLRIVTTSGSATRRIVLRQ